MKKGYVFDGWNTKADGSGANYAAGDTFIMGTESMVLYASWVPNPYSIEPIGNQTLEPKRAGYSPNTQETKTITIKKIRHRRSGRAGSRIEREWGRRL
ncbi:InlB B-repeat-containing protein [Cohnella rhizosphaerae]|uniref:InlB B-repeat-containing protein n=1 Tax=Cohnella rhizosphaerae TaxID=1457232 RepID=A0A9X4KUL6_9BACL|nr:InlB B-repeat-containing protein [Cohnella rhizosphaerae]MDG0811369.1 InlB B-repeat-containing protein [Cohnella rhizosphaerae]